MSQPAGQPARRVSNPAVFQACEFSYLGAMAGLLQALGVACDAVDVGGYSGYAFLMKATEGWIDPGSPSFHSGNVRQTPEAVLRLWSDFRAGTESLGVPLECTWDPEQFRPRAEAGREAFDDERRARRLFERIKLAIDADRPAVVWGLVVPEYGLVNGYSEDRYAVSTFRSLIGQPDEPVRYDQLQAKGGLEAIFAGAPRPVEGEAEDHQALRRAIGMAEGSPYLFAFDTPRHPLGARQRYVTGAAAYDEWADVLDRYAPDTIDYDALSYNAACAAELKQIAGRFLARLAERYRRRPQAAALAEAAAAYQRAEAEIQRIAAMFPFGELGDTSAARCAQAAGRLRAAQPHEQKALAYMRQALTAWR